MGTRTIYSPRLALAATPLLVLIAMLTLAACGGSGTTVSSSPVASASPSSTTSPVSAAGGTIAYARVDQGKSDIWVINSDGSGLTRLTRGSGWVAHPAWSPDGARIAYYSGLGDASTDTIWVMNADGSGAVRVSKGSVRGLWPTWSPDGKQLAFSRYSQKTGQLDVAVMNADGSGVKAVTDGGGHASFPAWASSGKIFFLRNGDVSMVNPDGSGLVRVTRIGNVGDFALSPDGKMLVVQDANQDQVVLLPVRGKTARVTVVDGASEAFVNPIVAGTWSPDQKAIALASSDYQSLDGSDLYIVNADGSGFSTVPNAGKAFDPAWRPE